MKQGGKPDLRINDAVLYKLRKEILRHQPKRILGLHELESFRGAREKIGLTYAFGRRHEIPLILLSCHVWIKSEHRVIAERAVEV
jgi:hypothetical protein